MNYLTLEVQIEHGKVVTKDSVQLPETGHGLLTILQPESPVPARLTPIEALEALQKHMQLDERKVAEWMSTVRNARR